MTLVLAGVLAAVNTAINIVTFFLLIRIAVGWLGKLRFVQAFDHAGTQIVDGALAIFEKISTKEMRSWGVTIKLLMCWMILCLGQVAVKVMMVSLIGPVGGFT